jgi:aryl-alcohol dehydrogenase-like predicted oxidoreductase
MATHPVTRREFVRDAAAGAALALAGTSVVRAGNPEKADTGKILNYNPDMEYRRCGKTNLMVSAVCLGGHWKRVDVVLQRKQTGGGWLSAGVGSPEFDKNRADVVTRCIERGINYVDACVGSEIMAYSKALKGRRDKMYFGFSLAEGEMRGLGHQWAKAAKDGKPMPPGWITQKLKECFDNGLKQSGLDYADLWRITCHEGSGAHSDAEMEEMMAALEWAKTSGKARFIGFSSHDRPHIKRIIEKFSAVDVIVTPYTAKTKLVDDESGLWAAMKKQDVGWFGIKPFASNSIFKGTSKPDDPNADEDNKIARLAIRYILCNPAITAPIPGLITPQQVDNVALAVAERRQLDLGEKAELDRAMDRAWANLPYHYQWLKEWEYV